MMKCDLRKFKFKRSNRTGDHEKRFEIILNKKRRWNKRYLGNWCQRKVVLYWSLSEIMDNLLDLLSLKVIHARKKENKIRKANEVLIQCMRIICRNYERL